MNFRGWIPTVNGRLSFKIIGGSNYPNNTDYANIHAARHQYIVVSQLRNLSDVLFDRVLAKILGVSGEFEFYFCGRVRRAKKSPDARLVGRIFLIRKACENYEAIQRTVEDMLRSLRQAEVGWTETEIREAYVSIAELLTQRTDIRADFVLQRSGICAISDIRWNDNDFARSSIDYEQSRHVDLEQSIADQMYFFMRDISHQHQHHSPDADTIITTQRADGDQLEWCADVVYALYYYIINIKRRTDPIEHVRVLGVLAYLQSFKKIVEERESQINKKAGIPRFNDETARESITATKNYIELLATRKKQSSDEFRTVLFTVSAIFLTLVNFVSGFADTEVKPGQWVTGFANGLKANAYICAVPMLAIICWWISSKIIRPRYDFKRDVIRISIANRKTAAMLLTVLALIILAIAYFIGSDALGSVLVGS